MNTGKEGKDMTVQNLRKITELKEKAMKRKTNADLRHIPNKSDVTKANENTRLLHSHQYRTLKDD